MKIILLKLYNLTNSSHNVPLKPVESQVLFVQITHREYKRALVTTNDRSLILMFEVGASFACTFLPDFIVKKPQ